MTGVSRMLSVVGTRSGVLPPPYHPDVHCFNQHLCREEPRASRILGCSLGSAFSTFVAKETWRKPTGSCPPLLLLSPHLSGVHQPPPPSPGCLDLVAPSADTQPYRAQTEPSHPCGLFSWFPGTVPLWVTQAEGLGFTSDTLSCPTPHAFGSWRPFLAFLGGLTASGAGLGPILQPAHLPQPFNCLSPSDPRPSSLCHLWWHLLWTLTQEPLPCCAISIWFLVPIG